MAYMYLDDRFLMELTFQSCWNAVTEYLQTFVSVSFLPHPEKCMLWASQQVSISGFIINLVTMIVSISQEKVDEIHNLCVLAMQEPNMMIRQLCRWELISVFIALQLGQAHYRRLEMVKIDTLHHNHGSFDANCYITPVCFPD